MKIYPKTDSDASDDATSKNAASDSAASTNAIDEALAAAGGEGERLRTELAEAKDRALRATAELDNYRKRMQRELDDTLRYANMNLMRDLLPIVDNLHRAIESAEKTSESSGLLAGVQMVVQQFAEVLARHHCKPIVAHGQPFDPNYHEAIMQQPSDAHAEGVVLLEATKGFQLHDRVVRPTQVIVSSGPPQ